jgi:hypothetical protein
MLRVEEPNDWTIRTFDRKGNLIHELDYHFQQEGIVISRHYGYQKLEETFDLFMKVILNAWLTRPMPKALVDFRMAIGTIKQDLPPWLENEFYPAIAKAGLQFQALVINHDPMNLSTASSTQSASLRHFQLRTFFDADQAMSWLRHC